ncbi:MAG TPA: large conductance mechanosensitive channel protein MscL [Chitinophagaceae bacterium]|nr:large conductance mechanosensitive channel protein MscL [Chitinophagaceae bacterium]
MGMIKEFKEFALKGNLVDIAVAFVMGAAFNRVVTAFTGGLISPLIGMLTGKDLSQNKWVIKEQIKDAAGTVTQPEVALLWGAFLTAIIDFIIVAFVMFLMIKAINSLKKNEPAPAPAPTPEDVILLREIRDALKK